MKCICVHGLELVASGTLLNSPLPESPVQQQRADLFE